MSAPIVDLCAPTGGAALVNALGTHACAWVVNHGVPEESCAAIRASAYEFFASPHSNKSEVRWDGRGLWKGWQPVIEGGAEYGGAVRPTELLERFEVNTFNGLPAPGTRWPAQPPRMRGTWLAYLDHVSALASRLVLMVAERLALPRADVPAWTGRQFSNLVANHYPEQGEPPADGRLRVNPHVDHGGLTILLVDDAPGGLESELDGVWEPVPTVPGALLVQGGELLEVWSGGNLRANRHRVVNPPREAAATARLSVVWFHHPDLAWELPGGGVARDLVQGRQDAYRGAA